MYKYMKIHMNKKFIVIALIIALIILGSFIWYKELGTNNEIPKKAKFVNNFVIRGERYQ